MGQTPDRMPEPRLVESRTVGADTRLVIDRNESLRSMIVLWLGLRDKLAWLLVGGDSSSVLEDIEFDQKAHALAARMNAVAKEAWTLAQEVASTEDNGDNGLLPTSILRKEVANVLASRRPMFSFAVEHLPNTF